MEKQAQDIQTEPVAASAFSILDTRIQKYRSGAYEHQKRRHEDWRETYSLYRDRVFVNRFTQRQSVNIPLMKETIRTLCSQTDEFTDIYFESLSGDKQKEIFLNEYWKYFYDEDKLELKDLVDKKQVGLYGRSIMKINLIDGRPSSEVLEPYDWLCDRYADPADIEGTANYQAHINIYRSLSRIEQNPFYDKQAIKNLKVYFATALGLIKSEENTKALVAKNQRLEDLGDTQVNSPEVGETYVELNEHYVRMYDEKSKRMLIKLVVKAEGETLLEKNLEDFLSINFFPFVSWADDIEKTDIWSDGNGDIVRTPNKIINSFFSQMVENRTLRNFGMYFYDSSDEKFVPQTYDPVPFGWYPVKGDPHQSVLPVQIPNLDDNMVDMNFVVQMIERATGINAIDKGVMPPKGTPVGTIKLALNQSIARTNSFAKFYRLARVEFGNKWYKFIEANAKWIKPVDLFKKSYKGNYFKETVAASDWKDAIGYKCKVVTSAERDQKTLDQVQKLQQISQMFPDNKPLKDILKKRALDMVDLSPDEIKEVMNFEAQMPTATAEKPAPEALAAMAEKSG